MNKTLRNFVLGAFATATLASTGLAPIVAHAATPNNPTVKHEQLSKAERMNLAVSDDGYQVMRDVHAARIALFNGDTDRARQLVDQAQQGLTKTRSDEKALGANAKHDPNLVSIDGQLVVGHDYVPTPEKTAALHKGNDTLKQGDSASAIEQLKLAEVDIGYARMLMPLAQTQAHVDEAAALLYSQNYYDANLALKQAEDGLDTETVMLVEAPKAAPAAGAEQAQAQSAPAADTAIN